MDAETGTIRRRRPDVRPGAPSVLIYSMDRFGWYFNFEATIQQNPGMRYYHVPRGLFVEARIVQYQDHAIRPGGFFKTPDDLTKTHPEAKVVLQRTYKALDRDWTPIEARAEVEHSPTDSVFLTETPSRIG